MKALTNDQAKQWCIARSIKVADRDNLYYDLASVHSFELPFPNGSRDLILQAFRLTGFKEGKPYDGQWLSEEEEDYEGSLLWLTGWGMGTEMSEGLGETLLEQMRLGLKENRPLSETPAHLFGPGEYVRAAAFLAVILLCEWDAFLIPQSGKYFIFVSHEAFSYVVASTAELYDQLFDHLRGWNPIAKPPYYYRNIRTT